MKLFRIICHVLLLSQLLAVAFSAGVTSTTATATATTTDSTQYLHFVAHNQTQTCTSDTHALPFNNQIRGVNLGGWMVLEPWITPSLFYQFLGKNENTTAMDMYSFCTVLGPEEGNKQLRRHWDSWVTEAIIEELAHSGAVNSLRLPVGDWMYKPYGPYVGCTDGALEYVDYVLDWAYANELSVLIDIHGVKGSQNGFDNSGQSQGFKWTSKLNTEPVGDVTFEHWPIRSAGWMGTFDPVSATYMDINYDNIQHALEVIKKVVDRYKSHPALLGLEPVNEPWQYVSVMFLLYNLLFLTTSQQYIIIHYLIIDTN
jgi:glucan 1,3-beta-glucosidase